MSALIKQIQTILLKAGSNEGVVVESYGSEVLVSMAGGLKRLPTNVTLAKGDQVVMKEGRIVLKRTTATDRVYRV